MTRFEATTAYWTMYIPSITFGIGSTLMKLDQLGKIQKPLMHAIVPNMGYSSKTCRHVVFGPRHYLGIGARDLVTERGVQQTLMFVKHIRSDQDLSKLLRIGLEWFQLQAGISLDQSLNAHRLRSHIWKSDGFGPFENSYVSSMLKYILTIFVSH